MDPFTSASFSVEFKSTKNMVDGQPNVDLYALASRSTTAITGADHYSGVYQTDGSVGVALQDDYLTPSTAVETVYVTGAGANASLLAYLNSAYDGGNGIGNFAVIRLSTDGVVGTDVRYNTTTSEGAIAADNASLAPTINFTAVPEPSAPILLGGAALLLGLRRNRRQG
ncbi:MAG: PEP-CTERM sorting domain-containing protein [Haloferula sp.]